MIAAHYNYWVAIALVTIGLYAVMSHANLIKKLLGLGIFQAGVFIFYISLGKMPGGTAPILDPELSLYSHPLPHVLILTAIVVGVATTALGLAIVVRINEAYATINEDEALALDRKDQERARP